MSRYRDHVLAVLTRLDWTHQQLADALSDDEQRVDPRTIRRWLADPSSKGYRRPQPYLTLALIEVERREMEERRRAERRARRKAKRAER